MYFSTFVYSEILLLYQNINHQVYLTARKRYNFRILRLNQTKISYYEMVVLKKWENWQLGQ